MKFRRLAIEGAVEFIPDSYPDQRGMFVSPFQLPAFTEAFGTGQFPVRQASWSRSKRGVVRGIHFTATPPGCAKYVYCQNGRALDIIVDLRIGSPTFGLWETLYLDTVELRAAYLPVGVGHGFVALEDDTEMCYLLSTPYVAENELAVSIVDPALELPIPVDIDPVLSERDRLAPALGDLKGLGILPEYQKCLELDNELRCP